ADCAVDQIQRGAAADRAHTTAKGSGGVIADRGVDQGDGGTVAVDTTAARTAFNVVGDTGITHRNAGTDTDIEASTAATDISLGQGQLVYFNTAQVAVHGHHPAGIIGGNSYIGDAIIIEVAIDLDIGVVDLQLVAIERNGAAL